MFKTQTRTFRQTLAVSLTKGLVVFLLFGALFGGQALGEHLRPLKEHSDVTTAQVESKTYGERLVEKHGCWMGEAPADMEGQFPGHVVVRYDGEIAVQYRGAKAVSDALDHIFNGTDNGVAEVVGFCR
jgi:hypothetical protein